MTENLQYRFLKLILGVSRRTSSWAVSTEMGRSPLAIKVFIHLCKYYLHLKNTDSPLLKAAWEHNKYLSGAGFNSWYGAVSRVFEFADIKADEIEQCDLASKFKHIFIKKWELERERFLVEGKLNVLTSIKDRFSMSSYLTSNICSVYKRAIAKVRLCAHKFPIETDRYMNVPLIERVCTLGCKTIGDEKHYLFDCEHPAIQKIYSPIIANIIDQLPVLSTFSSMEKLKFLLSNNEFSLLSLMGKLSHKILKQFQEITW